MSNLVTIGDALSQLVNVALFGWTGETTANESLSGRCYRVHIVEGMDINNPWSVSYYLINNLFFWQDNHCGESYWNDVGRAKRQAKVNA